MPPPFSKPIFVIAPGAALQPAHYGLLSHLLMRAGYGVVSAMLPSVGTSKTVTVEADAEYIRERMILPVIDTEEHDAIVISHSYSSLPASAATTGLSKEDRAKAGKKTAVIGQIFLAGVMTKGGDGKNLIDTFGGQTPPHIQVDEAANLIRCEDAKPPLFQDVENTLADSAVASCLCPSLSCFQSPIPRASWDEHGYQGRAAYIRTTNDAAVPVVVQDMMLQGTGQQFITKDMATGHDAQLAQPEELCAIILGLAKHFEAL